jgi:hypothetical protein
MPNIEYLRPLAFVLSLRRIDSFFFMPSTRGFRCTTIIIKLLLFTNLCKGLHPKSLPPIPIPEVVISLKLLLSREHANGHEGLVSPVGVCLTYGL